MVEFTNAIFEVVAGGISVLMTVVLAGWVAVVWSALADHHA